MCGEANFIAIVEVDLAVEGPIWLQLDRTFARSFIHLVIAVPGELDCGSIEVSGPTIVIIYQQLIGWFATKFEQSITDAVNLHLTVLMPLTI